MVVEFEQEYLSELYKTGQCKSKKYRFQPNVVTKYKKCIDILISANRIEDIFPFRSLNYEVLSGDKKGISSIRVNSQYRIEFTVKQISSETVVTICNILELSNHYK